MMNLFSIFDPHTSLNYSMNWLGLFIPLIFTPNQLWMKKTKTMVFFMIINKFIIKEFENFKKNKIMNIFILMSLFFMIVMTNFLGLFPYTFTSSSHLSMTLPLSLTLWLSIMMFNWMNKTNLAFAHLVPLSTPPPLMMFMVIIESISNIIRPLTLAVRLTANMIAGHLLLCLLGSTGSSLSSMPMVILITTQIALYTLETAVSIIQAYVFMTLMSLYMNEL
uniref:ATP synthase subunit a n=1 Tax=Parapolybia tinctipennis TaxID=2592911 RepID=A0A514CQN1_9HYME|nr:ATP synthase F0 subunit 6 [Parapolybia tinctipennis]